MAMEDLLTNVGLTKNEAAVYLAIIELGECTSGEIIKKARIRTGRIYDILNSLAEKGLVSFVIRNNVKRFLAADPARLLDYLKLRETKHRQVETELESALPEITKRKRAAEKVPRVEVYEGVEGFKTALNTMLAALQKGDEFQILESRKRIIEQFGPFFIRYHKRRIAKGISARYLYLPELIETARIRAKLRLSKVRILPSELIDPASVGISRDYVFAGLSAESPISLLIKSPEIARGYRAYFDFLWERSLPLEKFKRT